MPGYAEIYAELLYLGGEGYPLWYPSALRLGDVGYIRDGSFKQLYNIVDGPGTQSDAASLLTAIHSDRSPSSEHGHGESSAKKARLNLHDPVGAPTDPVSPSPSSSLAASPLISSVSVGMSRSHSSEPLLPHSAQKGSPTFLHRRFHSGTPPEPSQPPGRFEVRELATSPPFHMGPRMSSSFRCLGVNGDASVPSSPANVKIGFESSGGDGAILIPRDPTEITELDDLGELKAYVKKHYEWMYQTYGEAKSIKTKDLTLIYKQYRTSDWAMAVICHGDKRVKAEFEVFGSVSAGFWGNWSSGVTASQRGPHRPQRARDTHNYGQGKPPALLQRHGKGNSSLGVSIDGGLNHQSFSYASSSSKESAYNGLGRRSRKENTADSSPKPMDQTILINRLTVSSVLGFLPVRIKAAAEPRDPDMDRDQDHGSDAVSGQDGNQGGDDDPGKRNHWSDDPLEALHDWIHKHGGAQIKVSIATDDDCLQLLRQLGQRYASKFGLRAAVRTAADRFARISVDEAGFATVSISRVPFKASKLVSTPSAALDPSPKTTAADHDTQFDLRQGEHGSKYDCRCET